MYNKTKQKEGVSPMYLAEEATQPVHGAAPRTNR